MLSLILAALQLAPAEVRNVNVFMADYPSNAFHAREQGSVRLSVVITPSAKVEQCRVLISSGSKSLDQASCNLVFKKAVFRAARDEKGRPAYGLVEVNIGWRLPAIAPPLEAEPVAPLAELTVDRLPNSVAGPIDVKVTLLINDAGGIERCAVPEDADHADQSSAACEALPRMWPESILRTKAGLSARYVRVLDVRFNAAASNGFPPVGS